MNNLFSISFESFFNIIYYCLNLSFALVVAGSKRKRYCRVNHTKSLILTMREDNYRACNLKNASEMLYHVIDTRIVFKRSLNVAMFSCIKTMIIIILLFDPTRTYSFIKINTYSPYL